MKINHMILMILTILELHFLIASVEAFNNGEIIESDEATDYNFLFAILTRNGTLETFTYKCTATAISRNVLITAAHCFNNYWKLDPKERQNNTFYIYPAKHRLNLNNFEETLKGSIPINMNDVKKHPDYVKEETCPTYDIATITIKNIPVILRTIPLCADFYPKGKAISLIKAGFQAQSKNEPHIMNYGIFEIENNPNKCENNTYIRNNDTQFCTTSRNSYHTEGGDSGAPLLANTTHPSCLMGVVSCGVRMYTIFARPTKNDIWKELFLSESNITTIDTMIDTTLYYHIVIIIILILIVSIMSFFLFPKHYTTQTTPLLELRHLTVRELVDVLPS
ncbi:chymase-like [Onthophagus taurus]|uniref:chymase-like n=1 Tax=Onthophagus taurus TaxID=166361 RepID=UPI000C202476|nr:uncharacterized protein LOC111420540 [Onthophagus taurus]